MTSSSNRRSAALELAARWEETLGIESVPSWADFFELGGDSLGLTGLLEKVRLDHSCEIDLAAFLRQPTLETMASLVRASQFVPGTFDPVITLQQRGDAAPLFVVPGVQGRVLSYLDMARQFEFGHPLVALRPPGFEDDEPPMRSIEEIAQLFVSATRRVWPSGPIMLAGYSFGGVVCFEMARQLRESGDPPALLAILDTINSDEAANEDGLPGVPLDCIPSDIQVDDAVAELRRVGRLPEHLDLLESSMQRRWLRARHSHLYALSVYRPQPYGGEIHLLRTTRQSCLYGRDDDFGWRHLATRIVSVEIEGEHWTLLRPPTVTAVVQQVRGWIAEATGGPRNPASAPWQRGSITELDDRSR